MATIKPFKGFRPNKEKVHLVASPPYDVINSNEARKMAKNNSYSFLHVVKPEIDLSKNINPYDSKVYEKGKENFNKFTEQNIFFQDKEECLYLYQLTMNEHVQTGIVACSSVEDYANNVIKKHELTRPDKENDRKQHITTLGIHAEPVFLTYPTVPKLDKIVNKIQTESPEYNFTTEEKIQHSFWVIRDKAIIDQIVTEFEKIDSVYVADGHHRTAAAAAVGLENNDTKNNFSSYFLSVLFPISQLKILDYNRVVKDLNGLSKGQFIAKLENDFIIEHKGKDSQSPQKLRDFGMYIENEWYLLTAKKHTYNSNNPIECLDVTILSKYILDAILNIQDLRNDKRVDFVGGVRGMKELEKRVDEKSMEVAFSLYPVTMQQLKNISDADMIMPPKTTWFEPKLRSGLVVHKFI